MAFVVAVTLGLGARPTTAQLLERPWLDWQTRHAGRFAIHYPSTLALWAEFIAKRMPSMDSAVAERVGFTPRGRIDLVLEDPYGVSNGLAFTFVERPVIVFWVTPPDPRETIGEFRNWAEMLAVHELTHVAHLARPSRNPLTRAIWRLTPVDLGPIAVRAPRWVLEGYATYVEGALTGSGRPHGFWRAALLRQWAIEGRLPTYAQLSGWGDFEGSDFAYLAGSAFLEWLSRRQGDSTLVHVWRRLTARVNRSFDQAFVGVYGDPPAQLYGRFAAELTADAMAMERELAAAGIVEGEIVQRLTWATGDPAISPDGSRVALVLRSKTRPARLVVWRTAPEPDTLEARARERLLRRDPQDVPARRVYPPAKRAIATLVARGGRAYEEPRWFADGHRLLLSRATRRSDGALRHDLYEWTVQTRALRRLTMGAGVRDADPMPDGERAVALRCSDGHCDVVLVALRSGAISTVAAGDSLTSYSHPRISPDGRTIAVARHWNGRWRIVLLDVDGSSARSVDPDDGANRFDPAWLGPRSLVVTSDRAGTANLERLDVGASAAVARMLTRVTGAAVAPAPNGADSSIWFLALHSHGYDVRRLTATNRVVEVASSPLLDTRRAPASLERAVASQGFSPRELSSSRRYGIGSRVTRWFPTGVVGADGRAGGIAIVNSDVVGRLSVLAQGELGNGGAWRGAALDAAWRRSRPVLRVSTFFARQSSEPLATGLTASATTSLTGGRIRGDYTRAFDMGELRVGGGFSQAWTEQQLTGVDSTTARPLGFGEVALTARQTGDGASASESFWVNGTVGHDGRDGFQRALATLGIRAGIEPLPSVDLAVTYGRVTSGVRPFERFAIGGLPSTLVDPSLLTQRVTMSALPFGVAIGDRALALRAATRLSAVSPYYWTASARDGAGRFERWHRVFGVELSIDQGAQAVLGTPGGRITAGVAHSLDEPFADRTRAYVTIALRP